ncbi:hypothetical protein PG999_004528 [Apiospora kogelbergensis]|uniref:Uncharacterized protein n=1 Tax=Apiospora kogelbergensis TaxID=1337665 RepID=A0AAW0QZL3_9PEZI
MYVVSNFTCKTHPTHAQMGLDTLDSYNNPKIVRHKGPSIPAASELTAIPPSVVFVHGQTGDREQTWTAYNESEPWPQTLLPFGYDASVVDWKSMVSQSRIANHAGNLLSSPAAYRDDDDTVGRLQYNTIDRTHTSEIYFTPHAGLSSSGPHTMVLASRDGQNSLPEGRFRWSWWCRQDSGGTAFRLLGQEDRPDMLHALAYKVLGEDAVVVGEQGALRDGWLLSEEDVAQAALVDPLQESLGDGEAVAGLWL